MFLKQVKKRNPEIIDIGFYLHQKGLVEPNTYLLDLDYIKDNAAELSIKADEHNINLYFITKQIGRNPLIAREIAGAGIEKAVAVDPWEAEIINRAGVKIGNVGHLVQIPEGMVRDILMMNPEIITVYSVKKAKKISQKARELGRQQDIMLRILDEDGFNYEGQKGGFYKSRLLEQVEDIVKLPNVNIKGVTAFPCLLYNYQKEKIEVTPNLQAIIKAKDLLKENYNITVTQVNAPSVTCVKSIPLLKEHGATHGEPGHSLTGTTPAHADYQLSEKPAMIYLSEVSHTDGDEIYTYGGGFYERSHVQGAIVGNKTNYKYIKGEPLNPEMIDYYHVLQGKEKEVNIGDTVLYSFRTQIFVTRSRVAVIGGLHHGQPSVKGIYTSQGEKIRGGFKI
ncbi:MAG: YhfX family PLP-dependent enzyme [Halanaerobiales bacterium]